jgi:hypothetical protein
VGKYIPKEIRDKKLDLRKWKGHCKDSFAKLGYSGRPWTGLSTMYAASERLLPAPLDHRSQTRLTLLKDRRSCFPSVIVTDSGTITLPTADQSTAFAIERLTGV